MSKFVPAKRPRIKIPVYFGLGAQDGPEDDTQAFTEEFFSNFLYFGPKFLRFLAIVSSFWQGPAQKNRLLLHFPLWVTCSYSILTLSHCIVFSLAPTSKLIK